MAQYDPTKVITVVDGHILTGFGEDTMVTITRAEDKRTVHVGTQGETTFVKSANDVADVTFTLADNSPSNAKLMELYNQDQSFSFATQDFNYIDDVSGFGSECVVRSIPDNEKGSDLGEREWTLIVADYEEIIRGMEGVIE